MRVLVNERSDQRGADVKGLNSFSIYSMYLVSYLCSVC